MQSKKNCLFPWNTLRCSINPLSMVMGILKINLPKQFYLRLFAETNLFYMKQLTDTDEAWGTRTRHLAGNPVFDFWYINIVVYCGLVIAKCIMKQFT